MNCLSDRSRPTLPSATCMARLLLVLAAASGFTLSLPTRSTSCSSPRAAASAAAAADVAPPAPPELTATAPLRVALVVEPTPFTHVSGYANRFKETLRYLRAAGDDVGVITPDDKPEAPESYLGFPIETIHGFRWPLYESLVISFFDYPRLAVFASRVLGLLGLIVRGKDGNLRRPHRFLKRLPRRLRARLSRAPARVKSAALRAAEAEEREAARLGEPRSDWNGDAYDAIVAADADLIHVTSPSLLFPATLRYARDLEVPLIASYHTHLPIYARNYLGWLNWGGWLEATCWRTIRRTHNQADLTLVTSPQMKAEFEQHGVANVAVWSKGIDTDRFHPRFRDAATRAALAGGEPDAPLLLYVGRLGMEKRLRDLKPLLAALPGARLALVGGGPDEPALRAHFAGTRTHFAGMLHGDELAAAFASADVFVMPSDSETLGFVVLEAMASGVPVLGCDAGGVPSLIAEGETGFLFAPGDHARAAALCRALLDDRDKLAAMGRAARAEAEKWGWEAATADLRNVQYRAAIRNFERRLPQLLEEKARWAWMGDARRRLSRLWRWPRYSAAPEPEAA